AVSNRIRTSLANMIDQEMPRNLKDPRPEVPAMILGGQVLPDSDPGLLQQVIDVVTPAASGQIRRQRTDMPLAKPGKCLFGVGRRATARLAPACQRGELVVGRCS